MDCLAKIDPELYAEPSTKSTDKLKVILYYTDYEQCVAAIRLHQLKVDADIPMINAFVVLIPRNLLYQLASDTYVRYISANLRVKSLLHVAGRVVGARLLNSAGLTGRGVSVAIIDTGVYPHLDFLRPRPRIRAFMDFVNGYNEPYDDNGHGTFVAGIIGGNGSASRGTYRGIAPDSELIVIKAMNADGGGDTANILKGLQWIYDNKEKFNIRIMTLAFGADVKRFDRDDALVRGVNKLWDSGMVVVTAAGNSGPAPRTINTPGISHKAITVGASDDKRTLTVSDDVVASFSSRGPIPRANKPDLLAPGVDITSVGSDTSYLPGRKNKVYAGYNTMSGTSASAPIIAGMCALILENNPALQPDEVKAILKRNTMKICLDPNIEGAGLIYIK